MDNAVVEFKDVELLKKLLNNQKVCGALLYKNRDSALAMVNVREKTTMHSILGYYLVVMYD